MFKRKQKPDVVVVGFRLLQEHGGGQIPEFHEWYMPGRLVYGGAPEDVANEDSLGSARMR